MEVGGSGQLIIAGYVTWGDESNVAPYLTLDPGADYDYSPLVVKSRGELKNYAIITGVSGCEQRADFY